jgi:NAD(P)-dependent dehydrogenase (short-subunit alcohol dehydrogenase family)
MPTDEFRGNLETNLFGSVNLVRAALPVLRPRRSGQFLQVSTIGRRAQSGLDAYQTAAWALGGFSEILARESPRTTPKKRTAHKYSNAM